MALFLFTSCSTSPAKTFVRSDARYSDKTKEIKRLILVTDVAVSIDASPAYWSVKESSNAAEDMLVATKAYLEKNGFEIVATESPMLGGFKNPEAKARVAPMREGKVEDGKFPIFVSERLRSDAEARRNVQELIFGVATSFLDRSKPPSDLCCKDDKLRPGLDSLVSDRNADAILFVIGNGTAVPAGKSVVQGLATGIATTILTLGMFTYSSWDTSAMVTLVALVDAKSHDLLWMNDMRIKFDPTDRDFYSAKWANEVLFHLIPREAMRSAKRSY